MDKVELIPIGRIIAPHGNKGKVKLRPYNRHSPLWGKKIPVVLTTTKEETISARITETTMIGSHIIVKFDVVSNRQLAAQLRGHQVCITQDLLPPLDKDEFYYYQWIGLKVIDSQLGTLGKIKSIVKAGYDLLIVDGPTGEIQIPVVKELVDEADLQAKILRVHLPPGYLEHQEPER